MDDEPANAAAEVVGRLVGLLNNDEFVRRNLLSMPAPGFIRHDRRRVTPQPPADGEGWVATLVNLAELLGEGATYQLREVVATRGERLVAVHTMGGVPGAAELEFIGVVGIDEELERIEIVTFFDPEDADLALAELDRLHDELTHG